MQRWLDKNHKTAPKDYARDIMRSARRPVTFFGWVILMIPFASPRVRPMRALKACGGPNELESTIRVLAHGWVSRSFADVVLTGADVLLLCRPYLKEMVRFVFLSGAMGKTRLGSPHYSPGVVNMWGLDVTMDENLNLFFLEGNGAPLVRVWYAKKKR